MVKTIRDVLKAASKQQQEQGITKLEVLQLFLGNGYGDRRAIRRTNEAITGCQLQLILDPDGEVKKNDKGEPLYTCVWWVYARHPSDISLICPTVTDRQGFTHRIDDPSYKDRMINAIATGSDQYNFVE